MQPKHRLFIRCAAFAGILALSVVALRSNMTYMRRTPGTEQITVSDEKTLFKTIVATNPDTGLIGFELHKRHIRRAAASETQYNVVMRQLDPQTDKYKEYCADIIADLRQEAGNGNITINVFDSFEAYTFYADTLGAAPDANGLLAQHLVATYENTLQNDDRYCSVTYYPWSGGRLRETVSCN
jgi:hypothetical protein